MLKVALPLVLALSIQPQTPGTPAPQAPVSTTPGGCVKEVRDYATKRRAELPPPAPAGSDAATVTATNQRRAQISRQITADQLAMARACAAQFDPGTAPANTLADLASLYSDASQPERAKAAIDRLLSVKTLAETDRAAAILQAVQIGLREPVSEARNVRLEALVTSIDKLSDAVFDQKFSVHTSMNGYYRYDDLDGGIIEHSTWIIDAAKKFSPDQRRKYGRSVVGAYVNMAEAWAGQGMNDEAIALLRRAEQDLPDVPNVAGTVQPEIERLELVGTTGAPITAPRWLNMPAGKTSLDLKGKVTLLEFSAHWCVPCKESYPGVNRLRAKYAPQGFQVVLATQLWGYFAAENPLDADTEFARDKTYFAEHGLDVPIAVGDKTPPAVRNADGTLTSVRDRNDLNYRVGGIPQIMLVDKQGKVRLVMVGYDDANEPKLAKMIESLVKEK